MTKVVPRASKSTEKELKAESHALVGSNFSWVALLAPGNDQHFTNPCHFQSQGLTVLLGEGQQANAFKCTDSTSCVLLGSSTKSNPIVGPNSSVALLEVKKVGSNYALNGRLLGPSRQLIALFREDGIYLNMKNFSIAERPDKTTLRILDLNGEIAFQWRFPNPDLMLIQGTFYSESGNSMTIDSKGSRDRLQNNFIGGNCLSGGAAIAF